MVPGSAGEFLQEGRKRHFPFVSLCSAETQNQGEITAADTRDESHLKLSRPVQVIVEGKTGQTKHCHFKHVFPPPPAADGDSKWL